MAWALSKHPYPHGLTRVAWLVAMQLIDGSKMQYDMLLQADTDHLYQGYIT